MINAEIVDIEVHDIRFPTSMWHVGSDSIHGRPNHACTYVIIHTDAGYMGYGMAATLGRGNEFVVEMCKLIGSELVKNRMTAEIFYNFASFWRLLTSYEQFRWLGPESGVVHIATAAIVNALWDLWARIEDKPVWKLLTDMSPEQLVSLVDFRYVRNMVTEEDAIRMLRQNVPHKKENEEELRKDGYPAYTADIGWTYRKQQVKTACRKFKKLDFTDFKISVGCTIPESKQRCDLVRSLIGKSRTLVVDANQYWDKKEAIYSVKGFKKTRPYAIEEPTSPDDVLGHMEIAYELKHNIKPTVRVTCGETCANRVLCKQFMGVKAIDYWSLNVGRLGGVNEALVVYFMAKEHKVSTWGFAGGLGLGEMVQHLQIWEYICLRQLTDLGKIGYVRHQHGYFEDPIFIRNAHFMLPKLAGFSTQLKNKCIARWSYPEGTRWKHLFNTKKFKNELDYTEKAKDDGDI